MGGWKVAVAVLQSAPPDSAPLSECAATFIIRSIFVLRHSTDLRSYEHLLLESGAES